MRTTKKVISAVLAVCMLASTSVVTGFAANVNNNEVGADTIYSSASQSLDDEYAYSKNDLGATYSPDQTIFKVWAPTATEVKLNLYATGSDDEEGAKDIANTSMSKLMEDDKWTGVWVTTVQGDLKNVYYTYTITAKNVTGSKTTTKETQDIYSVATGVNGKRSMVCDLSTTNPEGWENDKHVLLDESTDSSVWEIHVKDFSWDTASGVSEANRGKYLAFTEEGTTLNGEGKLSTGIDYLKELGITTVQLTPVYDFESVNEAGSPDQFNWGYDPKNYNVPEGSYSSNPYDGNVRINEFKQMVQALHEAGISVVMDVVYNHTFNTESPFQYTVPDYYYRMNDDGTFSNGSGCGNETATERAMFRNFVIQSCMYWVNEYHIDGFRFDLMAVMDVETMNLLRDELDTVDSRLVTWGEGWTGGTCNYPKKTCTGANLYPASQANASRLNPRVALFNDAIRDGIKGSVWDVLPGFVEGDATKAKAVKYGIYANSYKANGWRAQAPSQCVTYAACHDNHTLYDRIIACTNLAGFGEKNATAIRMNKLAAASVFGAQGISFILAGEEMGRSKDGNHNSYNAPADLNMIKWQNIVDYADLVSYYKGIMQIRSNFSPLTAMDKKYESAINITGGLNDSSNQISYTIANDTPGEWSKIAFLFNSEDKPVDVTLGDTSVTDWVVIANAEGAGLDKLGEVKGSTFTVPAYSAVIAVDKASYEAVGLKSNMGKVKVNFVHDATEKPLDDSVILQGTKGTGYAAVPSVGISDSYVLLTDKITGEAEGVFGDEMKEVTYYYTDYVPESIKANADINGDGEINIMDVTELQKALAGLSSIDRSKCDFNYSGGTDINDVTMLQKYITGFAVSRGQVEINHYYVDANGEQKKITDSTVISGKVGDEFTSESFKVVGYAPDPESMPEITSGKIPYGPTLVINYHYIPSSLEVKLHVKHNGSLTWAPSLWLWGSNLSGGDSDNYTQSGNWPGDTLSNPVDGWYNTGFTYKGAGSYNVIVSNGGSTQTKDYKGFVDNEMWIVIDDEKVNTGDYLTFYTENPDTNPNAPIATPLA